MLEDEELFRTAQALLENGLNSAETARQLKLEDEEAEKLYRCALELLRERFFRYYYGVPRRKRVGQTKSA